ncbi:Eco57I restriction-modification methylase domain-containing protein [Candidatus Parcubacteria bacterium]|nr:Eco57I restriction-modification methylase domain-containing protein [Candidatus Parcubacteria bacterium]
MKNKQEILGQYFTKPEIVQKLLDLLFLYKKYDEESSILEPSFGTGNFIKELENRNFKKIKGFEIDEELTKNPTDFFDVSLDKKFDLIVGNPPFTKYNLKDSYYYFSKYEKSKINPSLYLEKIDIKKDKQKIENVFIYKALKHLRDINSTIGFVLPISFFIKNRNKGVKEKIINKFSTIIIYQNDQIWFDRNIPCCFAIFTNTKKFKDKIIIIYENGKKNEEVFGISNIHEELIPQIIFHKNNGYIKNEKGIPLNNFLSSARVKIAKSFKENNVSAKNILEKTKIPEREDVSDYKMAVVRVGNSSVGKCGLVNIKKDIINDMFYIFDFKKEFDKDKKLKENICKKVNSNIDYFRNITCRVGSKSIKKENIFEFKVEI